MSTKISAIFLDSLLCIYLFKKGGGGIFFVLLSAFFAAWLEST